MKKVWLWLSSNIGLVSVLFFLAFIPLYPKLPLINVIRTFVYIRLEDFLVGGAIGIYLVWRIRLRAIPKTPLTWPIIVYWGIGVISAVYSILFIGPKLEGYFPHLVALHFLRRIEYMMLFFMAYDVVVKKKSLISSFIWTLAGTAFGVIVYGLGEKLLGWPAFLTMNEQFAKGIPLRLPPTARIPSTFGGHYDLAAFVVLTIPILIASIFAAKKIWEKAVLTVLSLGLFLMLLLTESRTSFLVYLVGITATLIWYKKKWWIIPVILISFVMLNFVKGASDRFYKTFRYNDVIVDLSTGKPVGTLATLEGGTAVIKKSESPATENLPTGSQYIGLPPSASASGQIRTVSFTSVNLSSGSGEIATVSGSFLIQKALVYDISITTRLQAEWPNALTAFKRNILLGSGYSTLSVATDGDYMRMLGETGILGTLGFLGILLTAYVLFFKRLNTLEGYEKAIVVGLFGGLTGLMFNGILIDVFEASKVAFTLWLLLGVATALLTSAELSLTGYFKLIWKALTHDIAFLAYMFLSVVILFGSSVSNYFVADDFTWLKWAASSRYSDIIGYFTNAQGFFYRPIPKLLYFVLYAVFWLKPEGYHIVSLILYALASYILYLIMRHTGVKRWVSLVISLLFVTLSVHHENVFWISGLSSLVSGTAFFSGIYLYLLHTHGNGIRKWILYGLSMGCIVVAMLSYDGMLVAPLILALVAWGVAGKKDWTVWAPIILMPIYWLLRVKSGAVPPSGDYGYSAQNLPFNAMGNTAGYIIATFFGPKSVESWGVLREYVKLHRSVAAVSAGGIVALVGYFVYAIRRKVIRFIQPLTWFITGMLSLAAYIGLGNMSERYVLVASGFFLLTAASTISILLKNGVRMLWRVLIISVLAIGILWNTSEVIRVGADWKKASDISQQTLSIMNHEFFPLRENKDFIFIDTPIRYGRAWVFPTGLNDPLWHEFHFNEWAYVTTNTGSPQEAYAIPAPAGYAPQILIFENYQLKRLVKVVK